MKFLVLFAAVLATAVAVVPVLVLARRRANYSHTRQTISELGEAGARDEKRAALFAFAPAGHAWWLFVAALAFAVPALADGPALWLLALLGAGYIGAAIFPCDPGAPVWGTWRNNLHNFLAALGYLGAAAGMIESGRVMDDIALLQPLADVSRLAGQAALFGIFLLLFETPVRGLIQRLIEAAFYGWALLIAAAVAFSS